MSKFYRLLGIEKNSSTACHPQTDGQTERINQEVEQYIRIWCHYRQDDWADLLALAEFNYNNQVQSSTGYSPFFANYGRHPNAGLTPRSITAKNKDANKFVSDMRHVIEETQAALKKANEDMKRFHDTHKSGSLNLKPGDKVMVENMNIKTQREMKKLDFKRSGPVKVLKKIGESAYKVQLPKGWRIHDVFNEVMLTKYHDPEYPSQQKAPPLPEIIDEAEEYEVKTILDIKQKKPTLKELKEGNTSGIWYLVRWKDCTPEEDSWVAKEDITHAEELLEEFHKEHPDALTKKKDKGKKKDTLTRRLEIPMSSFPKELFRPMPPLSDIEDVDKELPSEKELIRLVFSTRD